jgi:hypothetical protein
MGKGEQLIPSQIYIYRIQICAVYDFEDDILLDLKNKYVLELGQVGEEGEIKTCLFIVSVKYILFCGGELQRYEPWNVYSMRPPSQV